MSKFRRPRGKRIICRYISQMIYVLSTGIFKEQ